MSAKSTTESKKPRLNKGLKGLLIGVTIFVILAAASIAGVAYAYQDKFYPGTKVAGIDVGGKTKEAAVMLVQEKINGLEQHKIIVTVPDLTKPKKDMVGEYADQEITTTAADLGLQFAPELAVDAAWNHMHKSFPSGIINGIVTLFDGYSGSVTYSVEKKNIQSFVDTKIIPLIGAPKPAKIDIAGEVVTIQPSSPGLDINTEDLSEKLLTSVEQSQNQDQVYVKAPVEVKDSDITEADLEPLAAQLHSFADSSLILAGDKKKLYPTKAQILQWFTIVQGQDGKISLLLDEVAIAEYLSVQSGIDSDASLKQASATLSPMLGRPAPESINIALVEKEEPEPVVAEDFKAGRYKGKYIEVNLATQRLYMVDGDKLVQSHIVSSGAWSTPTPKGEFKTGLKLQRPYSKDYGLYMPWWISFIDNEYGFHELPEWPNGYKEGENHLGTPVSHGCIRLGQGAAKVLYDWVDKEMPVYVY